MLGIFLSLIVVPLDQVASGKPQAVAGLRRFEFSERHMGTPVRIVLYAADQETADAASGAAMRRVADLDERMTDYKPESELMRLCDRAGGAPVVVSPELFFVLSRAQEVARRSDGAFDVTVGPLVRLWRQARRTGRLPEAEKLKAARELVGYRNVRLDAEARTVQLLKAGMKLDLGGIAKGYAADEALAALAKKGVDRALVAVGGDIAVGAAPPEQAGWIVAIAPLDPDDKKAAPKLVLHDIAVSTSGDAEQFVEIDGVRYSHIVDPRTGLGVTGRSSVTVVARHGIDADSLTKVAAVLGPEKGLPLIEQTPGATARVVRKTDKGLTTAVSKEFPKLVDDESKK